MMAGLIRSPNRFSPLVNPTGAAHERDTVLARMAELHMITAGQEHAAEHEQIKVARNRPVSGVQDNYAMEACSTNFPACSPTSRPTRAA